MILVVSIVLFLISLLVALVPIIWEKKSLNLNTLLSFCSGVLIATAFLHMLPSSMEGNPHEAGLYVLFGFLLLYILERFIIVHPCQEQGCLSHHVGISAFIGLSIHCILTGFSVGIAIQATDTYQIQTPFITAIIAHKIPESFSLALLLLKSKIKGLNVAIFILLFCLMTPSGILLSQVLDEMTIHQYFYSLLALSTGTFIYIATSDLIPQVHHQGKKRFIHLGLFVIGILMIYILE